MKRYGEVPLADVKIVVSANPTVKIPYKLLKEICDRLEARIPPLTIATRKQLLAGFDNELAIKEGWSLFNDGELQRIDELEMFASDIEAIGFVSIRAMQGSEYHKMALAAMDLKWLDAVICG